MSIEIHTKIEPVLKRAAAVSRERAAECYVVGGLLRDLLLQRTPHPPLNVDLAVSGGPEGFARSLGEAFDARPICIHKEHQTFRLACYVPQQEDPILVDITALHPDGIDEDLSRRDFTVNALATTPQAFVQGTWPEELWDPCGSKRDLLYKTLRVCNDKAFEDDPVRVMRAFSFRAALSTEFDTDTCELLGKSITLLDQAAPERVQAEMGRLLEAQASHTLQLMSDMGVWKVLCPELEACRGVEQGGWHHLDVLDHTIEAMRQLELLLENPSRWGVKESEALRKYLQEPLVRHRPRLVALKIGVLLHDIGKPATRVPMTETRWGFTGHERVGQEMADEICRRWRLSNRERDVVGSIVKFHLRPGFLTREENPSDRALFRFRRDTAEEEGSMLLCWLADKSATTGPIRDPKEHDRDTQYVAACLNHFLNPPEPPPEPLMDGKTLIVELGLEPGPKVGKILEALHESQSLGEISTPAEALARAKELLKSDLC